MPRTSTMDNLELQEAIRNNFEKAKLTQFKIMMSQSMHEELEALKHKTGNNKSHMVRMAIQALIDLNK